MGCVEIFGISLRQIKFFFLSNLDALYVLLLITFFYLKAVQRSSWGAREPEITRKVAFLVNNITEYVATLISPSNAKKPPIRSVAVNPNNIAIRIIGINAAESFIA